MRTSIISSGAIGSTFPPIPRRHQQKQLQRSETADRQKASEATDHQQQEEHQQQHCVQNDNHCSSCCWDSANCCEDESNGREMAYKIVAYTAVGFSLLAILAVAICMPIVYNFVDHIQRQTKRELESCKVMQRVPTI
jgi:hypothetical protein